MIVQTNTCVYTCIYTVCKKAANRLPTCIDVMHQLWLNQELWPYFGVKLLCILRCFLTNLPDWQEFYTTAGRTGHAKYQLWAPIYKVRAHIQSRFVYICIGICICNCIRDYDSQWNAQSRNSSLAFVTFVYKPLFANRPEQTMDLNS